MIPPYDLLGRPNVLVYNSLRINDPADASDDMIQFLGSNIVAQWNTNTNPHPNDDGSEITPVHRVMYLLRLDGILRAPTAGRLGDRVKALSLAFDPALASKYTSPSTNGLLALDFDYLSLVDSTSGTAVYGPRNQLLGYKVPSRYYVRARQGVTPPSSAFTGNAVPWTAELLLADPRRYLQTAASYTTIGNGNITNVGDYPSWPTITIVTSGASDSTWTLTYNSSASPLILDLSGTAGTYVVDCQTRTITKGGTVDTTIYVSGDYPIILPGTKAVTLATNTNFTSIAIAWRPAYVA